MVATHASYPEERMSHGIDDLHGSSAILKGASLSQEELDRLCVHCEDSDSSGDDNALYRVRRTRANLGGGLSQEELDSMCVDCGDDDSSEGDYNEPDAWQKQLDALSVTEDGGIESSPPVVSEAFLLRVRRSRCFLGEESAKVLLANAKAAWKVELPKEIDPEDGDVEEATTASGSSSPVHRRISGLSQEALDALCATSEDTEEPSSPEGSESLLLQVRRKRFYVGSEAADAFAAEAMAKALDNEEVKDSSECNSEALVVTKKGKPVGLCIDVERAGEFEDLMKQVPSPSRSQRSPKKIDVA